MIAQRRVRAFNATDLADRFGPAIGSLVGDHDLHSISLLRLHQFLWRDVPEHWATEVSETFAADLGSLFTEAEMSHHAAVCADPITEQIIAAYRAGDADRGRSQYREAIAATGLQPPDTRELRWSDHMGPHERDAYDACARDIEEAIATGTLRVGERRWQVLRGEITDYRLGQGWLDAIHTERRESWAHDESSPVAGLRRAVSIQLGLPAPAPADGYPALHWLLRKAELGITLTEDGYLTSDVVAEAVDQFGWRAELAGVLSRETDVPPLLRLRALAAGDMRAVEVSGARLALTPAGRRMVIDPDFMHERAVAALLGDDHDQPELGVLVREAALAAMLLSEQHEYEYLLDFVVTMFQRAGWETSVNDVRLDEAVRQELSDLFHRMWAIGLLSRDQGWAGTVSLGPAGRAAARAALRNRAISPRRTV